MWYIKPPFDGIFIRPTIVQIIVGGWVVSFFETQCRMWANAQRDGRPAEYRWSPLLNAAKFG